jgi:hypothetical protein
MGQTRTYPKNPTQRRKVDDHEIHKKHENFTEENKENEGGWVERIFRYKTAPGCEDYGKLFFIEHRCKKSQDVF